MKQKNLEDHVVILDEKDNVATALVDLPEGDYILDYDSKKVVIDVPEDINAGFKVALTEISKGEPIYKYGYVIGLAMQDIKKGDCVHVHNLISSI